MERKGRGNFAVGHPQRSSTQAAQKASTGLKRKSGEICEASQNGTFRGGNGNAVGRAGLAGNKQAKSGRESGHGSSSHLGKIMLY